MDSLAPLLQQHGVALVFVFVLLEQGGLPIPAVPALLVAGALAGKGAFTPAEVLAAAVAASLIADLAWLYAGARVGRRILGKICRISLEPDSCVRRTEDVFQRFGVRALLFAKFVPGLGTVGPPLAGAAGVGVLRFSLYSASGAFLWIGAWMTLGYGAGETVKRAVAWASQLGLAVAVALAVIIVGYVVGKFVQRQRFLRSLRIARISPDELGRQLAAGDKPLIVDLRSAVDVKLTPYGLPGAIRLAVDDLEQGRVELPRDRDVVVYCS